MVALVVIGITVVFAATHHRTTTYLASHLVRVLLGFGVLFFGMLFNHTNLARRGRWVFLLMTVALMSLTLAIGATSGAARRWLDVKFIGSVQPAEFAKYVLVVWLAAYFAGLRESGKAWGWRNSVGKPGAVALAVIGLTLLQPAIGTAAIMAASSLGMFVLAGVRRKFLGQVALVGAAAIVLTIVFVPYARDRWKKFVSGDRYHQEQSLIAIGSGGPVGTGLGEGKQKYSFLPKMHNDFIFASIGEEFGFLGALGIFLLYGLLFFRGMRIGLRSSGDFGQYLAYGISLTLFLYAIVHVAVTLMILPTTGQPLPFVSYGGTALVTNLFAAGVLLNVSRYGRARMVLAEPSGGWGGERRGFLGGGRRRHA
ncbi:MAG: FtsW/RodA/SpoVE family cell cycle protein [bacterium]